MSRTLDDQTIQEKEDLVDLISKKKSGVIDKDWVEIRDEFDLDINTETLRKAGVGIKLAVDANMISAGSAQSLNRLSDGYVERQKIRDLTRQVNDVYRAESRSELLRETIAEAVRGLPPMSVSYAPHCGNHQCSHGRERSLVLALGDIHYGADIEIKGLHGEIVNKFNHDVFEKRMERLLDDTVDILSKENLRSVHVLLAGDLIDGMLRQSQLMRLEYGMVESTMRFAEYMAQWLNELSNYASVNVYSASGNHSEIRPLKSKKREFADENMERIIMWYLKTRLASNDLIAVDAECKKYTYIDILGYSFLLLHGDSDKDIEQLATDTIRLYGQSIDFFVCGHKHREAEYPQGMTSSGDSVIIRVPSICGADSYAQSKGFGGQAGAVATVIEKGYGRRCVYPINLQ